MIRTGEVIQYNPWGIPAVYICPATVPAPVQHVLVVYIDTDGAAICDRWQQSHFEVDTSRPRNLIVYCYAAVLMRDL